MISERFNVWSSGILGAINGVTFGCLVEAVIHAYVWYVNRRMRELAMGSGEFVCPVEYPPHWWATPCIFMLVFAGASIAVHRFWPSPTPSVLRLWQRVGVVGSGALMIYALVHDQFVRGVFNPRTVAIYAILFALAAVFNYIFGNCLRMIGDYYVRSKESSLP